MICRVPPLAPSCAAFMSEWHTILGELIWLVLALQYILYACIKRYSSNWLRYRFSSCSHNNHVETITIPHQPFCFAPLFFILPLSSVDQHSLPAMVLFDPPMTALKRLDPTRINLLKDWGVLVPVFWPPKNANFI